MTYAIARVRGGDELGEAWPGGGMLVEEAEHLQRLHRLRRGAGEVGPCRARDRLLDRGRQRRRPAHRRSGRPSAPTCAPVQDAAVPFVMNAVIDPTLPLTVVEYLGGAIPDPESGLRLHARLQPLRQPGGPGLPGHLVTTAFNDSQVMLLGAGRVRGPAPVAQDRLQPAAAQGEARAGPATAARRGATTPCATSPSRPPGCCRRSASPADGERPSAQPGRPYFTPVKVVSSPTETFVSPQPLAVARRRSASCRWRRGRRWPKG